MIKIIPGTKFGKLTVVEEAKPIIKKVLIKKKIRRFKVTCSCGNPNDIIITMNNLRGGNSKSCGCNKNNKNSRL